ncbi:SLAM family member 9-like [Triplophysa dalaica]|uniref:SLAM family member 9-like n=1 Tax=Triplophysa dalaica TaxID=1582913 RepID=UPI0024E01464|nr:SLAM family member 9-like [Triplophysa dalaica]
MWTLIMFFVSVEAAAEADDIVKLMEGGLLRLNTDAEKLNGKIQILWTFENGTQSSRIAQYHGKIYTHYDDRFSGRVELDQHTGSLNISNISLDDAGLYKVLIVINKQILTKKYKVDVYAPVSVPDIKSSSHGTLQHPQSTSQEKHEFCSVVCSVKNDRDVFISWYKGDEIVNHSSSSDLSINLSLPLKLHYNDTESYSCTAANPVSNKSIRLHMKHLCPHYEGKITQTYIRKSLPTTTTFVPLHTDKLFPGNENVYENDSSRISSSTDCLKHCGDVEVLIRLILSFLVGLATIVFLVEHVRSTQNIITYSDDEICMRHQKV